jgi:hypothetical protein
MNIYISNLFRRGNDVYRNNTAVNKTTELILVDLEKISCTLLKQNIMLLFARKPYIIISVGGWTSILSEEI